MPAKRRRKPPPLVDKRSFGRHLRAARQRVGLRDAADLCERLEALGVPLSTSALYRYERGQRLPPIEVITALLIVLRPPGGLAYFADTFSVVAWEAVTARSRR